MGYKWKSDRGIDPWERKVQTADNRYNEGNLISDAENPVWSTARTGKPVTTDHNPCGYWTGAYAGNYILTSLTYALEVDEATSTGETEITEGNFRAIVRQYSNWVPESTNLTAQEIFAGNFKTVLIPYGYGP